MTNHQVKSSYAIAIITILFFCALFVINFAKKEIDKIDLALYISNIPLESIRQIAAVGDFDSNLIAHYTFDDNANDSAGSNNGTAVGGPSYVDGKIGRAVSLDGVDDYVNTGAMSMTSVTSISFSTWVYVGVEDFDGTFMVLLDDSTSNFSNNGLTIGLDDRVSGGNATNGLYYAFDVATGNWKVPLFLDT